VYGRRYGVAIFAKTIISSDYFFYWGKEEYLEIATEEYKLDADQYKSYVCLWADIKNINGHVYRYAVTHFPVTIKGESSVHQLEILKPFFEGLDTLQEFVLCGDFNAPRGKETFRRISEKYKDNIPLHYKTSIDQNLHRDKDQKIMFVVDGLFTTPLYSTENTKLIDGVSDHMAVVSTIKTLF
nr:endonuclease/exonuclease/phosphatase family protein [Candidatus Paceibacterota bacterium]